MSTESEHQSLQNVHELNQEETELFISTFGQAALDYIQQSTQLVVDTDSSSINKRTFLFTYAGRAVEMVIDGPSIGMHFSMIEDYTSKNPQKYEQLQNKENFGTSLKFMRFLNTLMANVKKDLPLVVFSASKERSILFESMLKKHGFTNAYFGHII